MDYVIIDGRKWNVLVTNIEESYSILYSDNSGRTISQGAPMVLDPLGTFFNYKITFARKRYHEKEFDELFDFLSLPRYDGIDVNIIHGQQLWDKPFKAYVSSGARAVKRIDTNTKRVYWDSFTANIVPIEAQVKPL